MNKIGIAYMPSIWHATLRIAIGCLSMFIFVGALGKLKLPTRKDLPLVITMGILQIGLFTMLINLGLMFVDAGRSSILVYTVPLWTTPLAWFLFKESISGLKAVGLGLGVIGLLLLFSPWSMDWSTRETVYGNLTLIGAAICMAVAICGTRKMKSSRSALELAPWQLLIGTFPVLMIAILMEPHPHIEWNTISISAMAYTAILATALGNLGLSMVSRVIPSTTTSLGLLGVPFTGVISAALILGEEVTPNMQIAMLLIFCGLICVALSANTRALSLEPGKAEH